jgi:hypothetical protein
MTTSAARSSALDSLVEKLHAKASSLRKEQRDRAEKALEEAADKAPAADFGNPASTTISRKHL